MTYILIAILVLLAANLVASFYIFKNQHRDFEAWHARFDFLKCMVDYYESLSHNFDAIYFKLDGIAKDAHINRNEAHDAAGILNNILNNICKELDNHHEASETFWELTKNSLDNIERKHSAVMSAYKSLIEEEPDVECAIGYLGEYLDD